jgi:hypothetical protein
MLIADGKLNVETFKSLFEKLSWIQAPRVLGVNHREFFYFCRYEEDDWFLIIKVRPSKWMQVSETFRGRTIQGNVPPENHNGPTVDWGSTVEVKIDQALFDKIKEVSVAKPEREVQTVKW